MGHMPAIPESTRDSITWRLILHAEKNWPQLAKVQVTCRGAFAYAAGILPGGEILPLFRLRYGGSAHSFGFAIYSHASERYEDAVLLTGSPIGTPQEALDTACTIHLAGLGHEPDSEPSTNLRSQPLSCGLGGSSRTSPVRPPKWSVRGLPVVRNGTALRDRRSFAGYPTVAVGQPQHPHLPAWGVLESMM